MQLESANFGSYAKRDGNRLKYNGKEEQVTGDLDFLDYGARMYDSGLGRWTGVDLLSEDYTSWSVYNFTKCNPVRFTDPNGMWVDHWTVDPYGYIRLVPNTEDKRDELFVIDLLGRMTGVSMFLNDRSIIQQLMLDYSIFDEGSMVHKSPFSFAIGNVFSQNEMIRLFFFLANYTRVEWRLDRFLRDGAPMYALGTLHDPGFSPAAEYMGFSPKSSVAFVHSHPDIEPTFLKEFDSMGWDMIKKKGSEGTDVGIKMFTTIYDRTMSYVYFPVSQRLWFIEKYGQPSFTRKITNYKKFFFGALNTK